MATVPTTEQSVFPIVGPNVQQDISRAALRGSAMPEVVAGIGNEIGRAGARYSAGVQQAQDQQDRLSYVYATSNLLKGKLDADEAFASDPNYQTWVPRYKAQLGKLAENYAGTIQSPLLRAQFNQLAMEHIGEGAKGLATAARGKETDAGLGWLSDTLNANRDTFLRAPDTMTRTTAVRANQSAIDTALNSGWIDPLRASKLRQDIADSYGLAYAATLPPRARAAFLAPSGSGVPPAPLGPGTSAAIAQAAKAHGEDAATLARTAQLEAGGDPGAYNKSSGASGLFQFVGSTGRAYGLGDDARTMPVAQQADAAARLQADNRASLTQALGRPPTGADLYLAHQQGAGGAAALLSNPDKNAVQALADNAGVSLDTAKKSITGNGGTLDQTAGQFATMWQKRFDAVPATGVTLLDQAMTQFPRLSQYKGDLDYKYSPGKGDGMLEFYGKGTEDSSFNKDKNAVEVFDPKTRPIDVAGDIVSHWLAKGGDPKLTEYYNTFKSSITPEQESHLHEMYDWDKTHEGEKRPYETWKDLVGLPGMFRGYAFDQWPDKAKQALFTPEQRQSLDEMVNYLKTPPEGQPGDGQLVFNRTGGVADSIPPDLRAQAYRQTLNQVQADDREAQAEAEHALRDREKTQAAQREAFTSDFAIDLGRGHKGYGDIEAAYQAGDLSAGDRTRFTLALDEQTKRGEKDATMMARAAAAGQGGSPLDPKNKDDRTGVNLLYDATAKGWGQMTMPQLMEKAGNFSYEKGIVPDAVLSMVRGGLRSGDGQQTQLAADMLTRLRNLNPQLLNDFSAEDISLGNQISSLTSYGVAPEKAVEMAMEGLKASPIEKEARGTAFDELVKQAPDAKWIEGKLNSVWTADPTVDPVMAGEFHALARQEYQRTGDMEAARTTALDLVNRNWGRTEVGGERRYMKYAPEKFYGVPDMSPAENAKWMNEQLLTDIKKGAFQSPDNPITADRLLVTPDPLRLSGGLPTYRVAVKGADGIYYGVANDQGVPLAWHPDWSTSAENTRRNAAQQAKVDLARKAREAILRGELPPIGANPAAVGGGSMIPPELMGGSNAVP